MRFVGVENNRICVVSNERINNSNLEIIEVPPELSHLDSVQLATNCRVINGKLVSKLAKKSRQNLKVALVGNWKMRCGIATYSENLWGEIVKHVGDFKLFIEKNTILTGPINEIGGISYPEDKVTACWKRGEPLSELIKQIKEYSPDIIWIQHEFGLWPNAMYWLSMMTQLSQYRIIVTMHSVFHHRDKTIVEAAMPEIVVHLPGAKDVLKNEKQVPGNVYVIPHGCYPCTNPEKLWNFYKSNRTFLQFGFGFRYKGWENSLYAVSILKKKYSDVFFTGLFSESPFNKTEHELYFNELMNLSAKLNIEDNIAILRGYQSDETLNCFLRTNQATVFPYISHPEHEVFGASGAARIAMSKGLPVVTSSVNHFSDLNTLKADSPEEIAAMLEKLFEDSKFKSTQIANQIDFLNQNTWEKITSQYLSLFEG